MVSLRNLKLSKFYKVVWEDIIAYSDWVEVPDGPKRKPAHCISYGWATDAPRGYIRLSATIGDNLDGAKPEYTQHVVIPKGCIISVEEIDWNEKTCDEACRDRVEGSQQS